MILILDNYDSFSWNLFDLVRRFHPAEIKRNDEVSIRQMVEMNPVAILVSPGPGKPSESGICREVILHFEGKVPILGICLGHQLIGEIFGAKIIKAEEPVHGKTSHKGTGVFRGIPESPEVMRYHSLIIDPGTLPSEFEIHAQTEKGEIMGIRHRTKPLEGLQFHPESVLSPIGEQIISNWIRSFIL
jgi:para-aminobenzoate synthetase component 2